MVILPVPVNLLNWYFYAKKCEPLGYTSRSGCKVLNQICVPHKKSFSCNSHPKLLVTVNPLLSPPGGLLISSPFEGGLNRDRGLI